MINNSGYLHGTASNATAPIRPTRMESAPPVTMTDSNVFIQYTIVRIRLEDNQEVQLVTRQRIAHHQGEVIALHDGMYRACLVQGDELVQLPFRVEEGNAAGEVHLDYTRISLEEQWGNGMRQKIGPTDAALPIGTLRETPTSIPTDGKLIDIIYNLCIRTDVHNTLPLGSEYYWA